jgi:hypothetical protein
MRRRASSPEGEIVHDAFRYRQTIFMEIGGPQEDFSIWPIPSLLTTMLWALISIQMGSLGNFDILSII